MCRPASMLVLKNFVVKWSLKTDSHAEMIREFGLCDTALVNQARQETPFVGVEIVPPDNRYDLPAEQWQYSVDDAYLSILPSWWNPEDAEKAVRSELHRWIAERVILANQERDVHDASVIVYGRAEGYGSSRMVGYGSSYMVGHGWSYMEGHDTSRMVGYNSSRMVGYNSSQMVGHGSSQMEGHDSSQMVGYDSSRMVGYNSSQMVGHDTSRMVGYNSSRMVGYNSSQMVGHGSSQMVGYNASTGIKWTTSCTAKNESYWAVIVDRSGDTPVCMVGPA